MEARFETFTVLINRISRNIRRIKNQEMAEYNLRSAHVSCLYYIYMSPGLTSTELCERCEEDKATISRAVEYLEENGYIVCNSKSAKKYKCPIALTSKGQEVGKRIAEKINRVLDEIKYSLSEEERISFYKSLMTISSSLEKLSEQKEN